VTTIREHRFYTTSADYVYQELRHQIVTKQIPPGRRLPEVNIAVKMGVSRTPVREALRRLASEGLVVIVPNSGARVASPSFREMEDAYVVRESLECLAVRLAAARIADRQLRKLEESIHEEEQAFNEKNLELYLEINDNFHRVIADASGNRVLAEYVENILARTNVYIVFYDPFYDIDSNPSLGEHRGIVEAFRVRDVERAVELMRSHIRLSRNTLIPPEEEAEAVD
jgi:DNA-binding GntR family transcriptional regulator